MEESEKHGESKPATSVVFIHSALDDYGLTASQFRVFCHIARRGVCYAAIPEIARVCRLNEDTVSAAIGFLVLIKMITKTKRTGQTSLLKINPVFEWIAPPGKKGVGGNEAAPLKSGRGYRKKGGYHHPEKRGDKGNPSEGNPIKGIPTPKFEPVKRGLFQSEYEKMMDYAHDRFKAAQEHNPNYEWVLKPQVYEACKFLRKQAAEQPEFAAEKIAQAEKHEKDRANWIKGKMNATGLAELRAWHDRKLEISAAMNGILEDPTM